MQRLNIPSSKITFGTFLARGGFGTVFKGTYAKDPNTQPLQVAVKVLNTQASPHAGVSAVIGNFTKEVQVLESVSAQCEHVCRFHGVTEDKGQPALVMKLYSYSLAAELQAAPGHKLEEGVLLRRAMDICSGLQEVHAMGVIIRDIKPANVLVAENGTAVLADFGLARAVVSKLGTTKTQVAGTAPYMSPEMFDPELGDTTTKVDIWALACTIIEMATGYVYPSKYSTETQIMTRVIGKKQGPDIPSSLPKDLQRLLQGCFAIKPQDRPSAKEVLQVLSQISTGSKSRSSGQVQVKADSSTIHATPAAAPKVKPQPHELFKEAVVEQLQLSTNSNWPMTLVYIMSDLGSDEASTKLHFGLDKETKYRVCASLLGQLWKKSTDEVMPPLTDDAQKALAKVMVQGPMLDYMLTTSIKPFKSAHGPGQAHMAYVFRRVMHYCGYSSLTEWSVTAGNMSVVVQTLEGGLKVYVYSRPGLLGGCPTIAGTDIPVYSVLHEVCENLLIGARNLILEKGTWDDSYNRKNMFTNSGGFDVCVKYFKHGTTELRSTAMSLLEAVIAEPHNNSYSQRLSKLRSTTEMQGTLTKLAKSKDDSDSTQAVAKRLLSLW